jgi:hypothetical protein
MYRFQNPQQEFCPQCADVAKKRVPRFSKLSKSNHYFLTFDIAEQLRRILLGSYCSHWYNHIDEDTCADLLRKRISNTDMLLDITDGERYRLKTQHTENNITFTFCTDGGRVSNSSKRTLWPVFMIINELSYEKR